MRTLSRFEHDMLRITYCLVGQASRAEAIPLMRGQNPRPPCLSQAVVGLLQTALAKGIVRLLAHSGWRRERYLRGDLPVEGRLWQRFEPAELAFDFSPATIELLYWLTSKHSADPKPRKKTAGATLGDQFVAFLVLRALESTPLANELRSLPAIHKNALCRLAFVEEFCDTAYPAIDWTPWITAPGVAVFEALQHELSDHWIRLEQNKMAITRAERMLNVGLAQRQLLDNLLDALEVAGRRDLARFLLMAGARLLAGSHTAESWLARLSTAGLTLGQRSAVAAAAFAFLRVFDRFQQWERQARTVGYFDAGYAASQLWKSDWERYAGAACCSAAQAIVRQSDPLRVQARPPAEASPMAGPPESL
jgi:hypothetical protein